MMRGSTSAGSTSKVIEILCSCTPCGIQNLLEAVKSPHATQQGDGMSVIIVRALQRFRVRVSLLLETASPCVFSWSSQVLYTPTSRLSEQGVDQGGTSAVAARLQSTSQILAPSSERLPENLGCD
eukprot:TRINITY_DN13585_c1_g1_i2.p1 TRINITY_DN13585_c1_g1~~TRINITY_DN13585_c1_g1_i2.p1  ORF type:complete len:125 (+),score=5.48 TRINITY_DN13585_c1_g1_i2:222-596(+)